MKSETCEIAEIGKITQGITFNRYIDQTLPPVRILQVADLEGPSIRPVLPSDRKEGIDTERWASALARPGQILIALRTSMLKAALVPDDLGEAIVSSSLTILEVDETKANARYVAGLLRSKSIQNLVAPLFVGTTVPGIPLGRFKELEIPLPPLSKQEAIAEAIDALIDYQQQTQVVSNLMQEQIEATIHQLAN